VLMRSAAIKNSSPSRNALPVETFRFIGIWPLLLIVDQSPEPCIGKASANHYNANKLKPLPGEFNDLNGCAISIEPYPDRLLWPSSFFVSSSQMLGRSM
jgi:hypothetical protein